MGLISRVSSRTYRCFPDVCRFKKLKISFHVAVAIFENIFVTFPATKIKS